MSNFLPIFIILFSTVILSILMRHITRPLSNCIFILMSSFSIYLFLQSNSGILNSILYWFSFIILLSIYILISFKIKYDFTRKIVGFTMMFYKLIPLNRKNGDRVVGRVIPYSNHQLKYNSKPIIANEIVTAGATLISGSSGSGKTYGMMSLIKQNINDGSSVIFADYKGDPKVIQELINYASSHNFKIYNLSDGRANFNYDPLRNLNNVGRIEAVMNMRKWSMDGSDAHYKTGTQLLLQKLVGDFSKEFQKMEHSNQNISYTFEFFRYVKTYQPALEFRDSWLTVSKLLELLITSSLSPMFKFSNKQTFSFEQLKNEKFLLIVSFVSSNKELATSFSSLLFRDLLDECTIEPPYKNIYLYIDECGTLENQFIIKDILEKGRSGRIATTLSMQDINQIVIQTNEAYLNSILGTINSYIIYAGATRITAEKFAGVQLMDIESIIMNLRKPINGKSPTAIYISKYPTLNKRITSEVYRFEPYIFDQGVGAPRKTDNLNSRFDKDDYQIDQEIKEIDAMVSNNLNLNKENDQYDIESATDISFSDSKSVKKTNIKLNLNVGDEETGYANYDDLI